MASGAPLGRSLLADHKYNGFFFFKQKKVEILHEQSELTQILVVIHISYRTV